MPDREAQREWLGSIFGKGFEGNALEKRAAGTMYHEVVLHSKRSDSKESIEQIRSFVSEVLSAEDIEKLTNSHKNDHKL